ncbi:DUF4326 domain-containing protein [Chroococcidiopsis sp. CCMEE 29]|uniref:DUF4326 domain-containing protein n=1 Tax=Chroococcidiopsis sp. CCMEE 29 TaxID=155894 RepID=UPI00202063AE|nr:DUF4326 domain-containing protein [Chroococcidiopsis sp. CCMEE 29]
MKPHELELLRRHQQGETVVINKGHCINLMKHLKGQGVLKPIHRPMKLHNPFCIDRDGTREEVIQKYRDYLADHPELMPEIEKCRGKILMCFCHPQPCHGDVIIQILNETAALQN